MSPPPRSTDDGKKDCCGCSSDVSEGRLMFSVSSDDGLDLVVDLRANPIDFYSKMCKEEAHIPEGNRIRSRNKTAINTACCTNLLMGPVAGENSLMENPLVSRAETSDVQHSEKPDMLSVALDKEELPQQNSLVSVSLPERSNTTPADASVLPSNTERMSRGKICTAVACSKDVSAANTNKVLALTSDVIVISDSDGDSDADSFEVLEVKQEVTDAPAELPPFTLEVQMEKEPVEPAPIEKDRAQHNAKSDILSGALDNEEVTQENAHVSVSSPERSNTTLADASAHLSNMERMSADKMCTTVACSKDVSGANTKKVVALTSDVVIISDSDEGCGEDSFEALEVKQEVTDAPTEVAQFTHEVQMENELVEPAPIEEDMAPHNAKGDILASSSEKDTAQLENNDVSMSKRNNELLAGTSVVSNTEIISHGKTKASNAIDRTTDPHEDSDEDSSEALKVKEEIVDAPIELPQFTIGIQKEKDLVQPVHKEKYKAQHSAKGDILASVLDNEELTQENVGLSVLPERGKAPPVYTSRKISNKKKITTGKRKFSNAIACTKDSNEDCEGDFFEALEVKEEIVDAPAELPQFTLEVQMENETVEPRLIQKDTACGVSQPATDVQLDATSLNPCFAGDFNTTNAKPSSASLVAMGNPILDNDLLGSKTARVTDMLVATNKKSNDQIHDTLHVLQKIQEKLHQKQRLLRDRSAQCDMDVQTMLTEGEMTPKVMSIIKRYEDGAPNIEGVDNLSCSEETHQKRSFERRKLGDTKFLDNNCKELDDICRDHCWIPPTYILFPREKEGMYQSAVHLTGLDFDMSTHGDLQSSPREARESAAANMLYQLHQKAEKENNIQAELTN